MTTYSVSALTPRGELHTFDGVEADSVDAAEAATVGLLRRELEAAGTWRGFVRVDTKPSAAPPMRWLDDARSRPAWLWWARGLAVAAVAASGVENLLDVLEPGHDLLRSGLHLALAVTLVGLMVTLIGRPGRWRR